MEARVSIFQGDGVVRQLPLESNRMVIGRNVQADVQLIDEAVSRRHCELFRDPFGRWWVRDLGSRNGILVNHHPVQESILRHGDELQVGQHRLRFDMRDPSRSPMTEDGQTIVAIRKSKHEQISTLHEQPPARIDGDHLATIHQFTRSLQQATSASERLGMLCSMVTDSPFNAYGCTAIRIPVEGEIGEPEVLCKPNLAPNRSRRWLYLSNGLLETVRKDRRPVLASNASLSGMAMELSLSPDQMFLSAVACPLGHDDRSIDMLYATFPPEFSSAEWLALLTLVASQYMQVDMAAEAEHQALRHAAIESELERAREIQSRLVPRNPVGGHADVAIGFEPCRWVGGDYADLLKTPDGDDLLIVADVMGKGLPAALIMSSLHSLVHSLVGAGIELGSLMNAINRYLCQHIGEGSFVTMSAISIGPADRPMGCVNAGHTPSIVIRPDGKSRLLDAAYNTILGVSGEAMIVREDKLDKDELLVMFSDGLTDQQNDEGHQLGMDGLISLLERDRKSVV